MLEGRELFDLNDQLHSWKRDADGDHLYNKQKMELTKDRVWKDWGLADGKKWSPDATLRFFAERLDPALLSGDTFFVGADSSSGKKNLSIVESGIGDDLVVALDGASTQNRNLDVKFNIGNDTVLVMGRQEDMKIEFGGGLSSLLVEEAVVEDLDLSQIPAGPVNGTIIHAKGESELAADLDLDGDMNYILSDPGSTIDLTGDINGGTLDLFGKGMLGVDGGEQYLFRAGSEFLLDDIELGGDDGATVVVEGDTVMTDPKSGERTKVDGAIVDGNSVTGTDGNDKLIIEPGADFLVDSVKMGAGSDYVKIAGNVRSMIDLGPNVELPDTVEITPTAEGAIELRDPEGSVLKAWERTIYDEDTVFFLEKGWEAQKIDGKLYAVRHDKDGEVKVRVGIGEDIERVKAVSDGEEYLTFRDQDPEVRTRSDFLGVLGTVFQIGGGIALTFLSGGAAAPAVGFALAGSALNATYAGLNGSSFDDIALNLGIDLITTLGMVKGADGAPVLPEMKTGSQVLRAGRTLANGDYVGGILGLAGAGAQTSGNSFLYGLQAAGGKIHGLVSQENAGVLDYLQAIYGLSGLIDTGDSGEGLMQTGSGIVNIADALLEPDNPNTSEVGVAADVLAGLGDIAGALNIQGFSVEKDSVVVNGKAYRRILTVDAGEIAKLTSEALRGFAALGIEDPVKQWQGVGDSVANLDRFLDGAEWFVDKNENPVVIWTQNKRRFMLDPNTKVMEFSAVDLDKELDSFWRSAVEEQFTSAETYTLADFVSLSSFDVSNLQSDLNLAYGELLTRPEYDSTSIGADDIPTLLASLNASDVPGSFSKETREATARFLHELFVNTTGKGSSEIPALSESSLGLWAYLQERCDGLSKREIRELVESFESDHVLAQSFKEMFPDRDPAAFTLDVSDSGGGLAVRYNGAEMAVMGLTSEGNFEVNGFRYDPDSQFSNESVMALQTKLKENGFYNGDIDGVPGPDFMVGIRLYHAANLTNPNPFGEEGTVVGPGTAERLFNAGTGLTFDDDTARDRIMPFARDFVADNIFSGDAQLRREATTLVQAQLIDLGYLDSAKARSGVMDDDTRVAWQKFKIANELEAPHKISLQNSAEVSVLFSDSVRPSSDEMAQGRLDAYYAENYVEHDTGRPYHPFMLPHANEIVPHYDETLTHYDMPTFEYVQKYIDPDMSRNEFANAWLRKSIVSGQLDPSLEFGGVYKKEFNVPLIGNVGFTVRGDVGDVKNFATDNVVQAIEHGLDDLKRTGSIDLGPVLSSLKQGEAPVTIELSKKFPFMDNHTIKLKMKDEITLDHISEVLGRCIDGDWSMDMINELLGLFTVTYEYKFAKLKSKDDEASISSTLNIPLDIVETYKDTGGLIDLSGEIRMEGTLNGKGVYFDFNYMNGVFVEDFNIQHEHLIKLSEQTGLSIDELIYRMDLMELESNGPVQDSMPTIGAARALTQLDFNWAVPGSVTPQSDTSFKDWVRDNAEPLPPSDKLSLNCAEFVFLSAIESGAATRDDIKSIYDAREAGETFTDSVVRPGDQRRLYYTIETHDDDLPPEIEFTMNGYKPQAGDILFLDGTAHVAMFTGEKVDGEHEVISFPAIPSPWGDGLPQYIEGVKAQNTTLESLIADIYKSASVNNFDQPPIEVLAGRPFWENSNP
ncbi:MAG: hypothetical protein GF363_10875 [Chitinivibrionales bacterium]|nr:hypothetical protein [Chitinivibrionales bacterium]